MSEALRFLEMAAAKDRPESLLTLARVLICGDGVPSDLPRAIRLMRRAASRGYALAQVELASAFYVQFPSNVSARWQRRISLEPVPDALAKYTRCGNCQAEASNRCGKCGIVKYCTQECQHAHYKTHKIECNTMQAWAADPLGPRQIVRTQSRRGWWLRFAGWMAFSTSFLIIIVVIVVRLPSIRQEDKRPVLVID